MGQFIFEPVQTVPCRVCFLVEADSIEEAKRRLQLAFSKRAAKTYALSLLESAEEARQEGAEVYRIGKRGRIERTDTGNNVKSP